MLDQKKVGSFLKILRKEKGLTQEQLAERFEVSGRTISRWETGKNFPDINMLIELAEYYDVDVLEIIKGERKSEIMTDEVKETIQNVAGYANAERAVLLKTVKIISIVGLVSLLIGLLMETISPDSMIPVYECVKGLCFGLSVGALITMVLYTTGNLAIMKEKKSKHMKKVTVLCFAVMMICLMASIIASII